MMRWWENDFLRVHENRLFLGGREATEIARKYGTPLYVYGKEQVLDNYRRLQRILREATTLETRICYAMKANPNAGILAQLKSEGAWIDAVSPGEVRAALAAGFTTQKILFTGTSLSSRDLRSAFGEIGLTVNIDALEQLDLMTDVKTRSFRNRTIRVSVRWNPGLGRGFSPRAITAGERSSDGTPIKFGVEQNKVLATYKKAAELGFSPVGLHQHLGSGWVKEDFETVKAAVDKMIGMASTLEQEGFGLEFLDFGGGFGPRYRNNQKLFPVRDYIQYICKKIHQSRLGIKAVAVEPGKYLTGDAGVLLLRVEYVKESYGHLFACVDGGTYNTVPRPAIYSQAYHEIISCSQVDGRPRRRITIAGNLCETGDVFGRERLMPPLKRGDILAVLCAGAYCRSMASCFNLRQIPKEISI
jgi:diaminopimelate decarboxylase